MERRVESHQAESRQDGLLSRGNCMCKDLENRNVAELERTVGKVE